MNWRIARALARQNDDGSLPKRMLGKLAVGEGGEKKKDSSRDVC